MIIIIDNGDTFEGTLDQFEDSYFSNATFETVAMWCEDHNMTLSFKLTAEEIAILLCSRQEETEDACDQGS